MKCLRLRLLHLAAALLATFMTVVAQADDKRPNILLIVADDMGYADIGSYGGEIRTRTWMRWPHAA